MPVNNKLNIHSILKKSTVNGPGVRSVIWFQGCSLNCFGCFNKELQSFENKNLMSIDEIIENLPIGEIDGVTISGGEPFLQIELLYSLVKRLKEKKLTVIAYTGFTLNELMKHTSQDYIETLSMVDVLIEGRYISDIPPTHPWTGSGNQNVYILGEHYWEYNDISYENVGEIVVTSNGEVIETGFIALMDGELKC